MALRVHPSPHGATRGKGEISRGGGKIDNDRKRKRSAGYSRSRRPRRRPRHRRIEFIKSRHSPTPRWRYQFFASRTRVQRLRRFVTRRKSITLAAVMGVVCGSGAAATSKLDLEGSSVAAPAPVEVAGSSDNIVSSTAKSGHETVSDKEAAEA